MSCEFIANLPYLKYCAQTFFNTSLYQSKKKHREIKNEPAWPWTYLLHSWNLWIYFQAIKVEIFCCKIHKKISTKAYNRIFWWLMIGKCFVKTCSHNFDRMSRNIEYKHCKQWVEIINYSKIILISLCKQVKVTKRLNQKSYFYIINLLSVYLLSPL